MEGKRKFFWFFELTLGIVDDVLLINNPASLGLGSYLFWCCWAAIFEKLNAYFPWWFDQAGASWLPGDSELILDASIFITLIIIQILWVNAYKPHIIHVQSNDAKIL